MDSAADKNLAAVCSLFCGACALYIGTTEEPARLEKLAARMGRTTEEMVCYGCRAERRSFYCRTCRLYACAAAKGHEFCGQCAEYPCGALRDFQAERPHRAELWQDQARIGEVGWQRWLEEKPAHYACPDCATVNSAYDAACRRCGRTPSCRYVEAHKEEIDSFWARQK
jgi:hypothetical protein